MPPVGRVVKGVATAAGRTTGKSGFRLSRNPELTPEPFYKGYDGYDVLDKDGNPRFSILIDRTEERLSKDPEDLYVTEVVSNTPVMQMEDVRFEFGPGVIRDTLRQLRLIYPEAKTISGFRISGGRAVAAGMKPGETFEGKEAKIKLRELLVAAGLGEAASLFVDKGDAEAAGFDDLLKAVARGARQTKVAKGAELLLKSPSKITGSRDLFEFVDEAGTPRGQVIVSREQRSSSRNEPESVNLIIEDMYSYADPPAGHVLATGGPGEFGPANVLSLLRQLKVIYPEAETISGWKVRPGYRLHPDDEDMGIYTPHEDFRKMSLKEFLVAGGLGSAAALLSGEEDAEAADLDELLRVAEEDPTKIQVPQSFERSLFPNEDPRPSQTLPPLTEEVVGRTPEGREIYRNTDGSESSERSISIMTDQGAVNIPTMFGGREVSQDEALRIIEENDYTDPETGRKIEFYPTEAEADEARRREFEAMGDLQQGRIQVPAGGKIQVPELESGGQILTTSIDKAKELDIFPSIDEAIYEAFLGASITVNQVREALTTADREYMELQLEANETNRPIPIPGREGLMIQPPPPEDMPEIQRRYIIALEREQYLRSRIQEDLGAESDNIVGPMIRTMTRIGMYAPLYTVLRGAGAGPTVSTIVGGTIASQAAFEADEPRLSDMLIEIDNPLLNNAVTKYLASDPTDSKAHAEFKQALEETILGVATLGAFRIGGTALTESARKANAIYKAALSLKRKQVAVDTGVSADNKAFNTTFRSGLESADAEVAKLAENLLRRPAPQEIISGLGKADPRYEDMALNAIVSEFENGVRSIGQKYSKLADVGQGQEVVVRPSIFTENDVAQKVELFRQRRIRLEKPPDATTERASNIKQAFDKNDAEVEEASKRTMQERASSIRRHLREGVVDRSGTVKREILEASGEEGAQAVRDLERAQGATVAAQRAYEQAYRRIFRDTSRKDRKQLANLIRIRRIRQIKTYDPDWEPPVLGKKANTSVGDYDEMLNQIRNELGEEQYARLMRKGDQYFEEMTKSLDVLRETGVISDTEYAALSRFQFSPVRFLEIIDPANVFYSIKGQPISVRSSGIKALEKGEGGLMLNDPEAFLGQVLARAYGRAFKNRANQGLYNFAKSNPNNLVARITRPKKSNVEWAEIGVRFNGEDKKVYLRKDLIDGWRADPVGTALWPTIVQNTLSGSWFVRPLATGAFAPEFAPVNFMYDTWFAMTTAGAGRLYSPWYPIATMQLGRDLKATAKDAFTRTGAFNDYIEQGGGVRLLSHQGRLFSQDITHPQSVTSRGMRAFEYYSGYVNESAEIWVRLAIRNRTLRRLKAEKGVLGPEDYAEATWEARRYLDFDQGGYAAKLVDRWVPYTNAALQGFRGLGRAVRENPVEMGIRASQIMGSFASLYWANHMVNSEAWNDIPSYVRNNNLIITTPFFRRDRNGNKRYMYFKIPLEHSSRPLKALVDGMLDRSIKGKMPDNSTLQIIGEGTSIFPGIGSLPPSLTALIASAANYDWWRGEQIWRGDTSLPPTYERNITGEDPTSTLSIDIAEGVNPILESLGAKDARLSPERLDVAGRAIFPRSVYTDVVGAGYKTITRGVDEELMELHSREIQEVLADAPFVRRFIGETHPFSGDVERLKNNQEVASAHAFLRMEEIRKQIDLFRAGDDGFGARQAKSIRKWINEQDPIYRKGLHRYLNNQIELENVFERYDPDRIQGTPSRTWWVYLSSSRPEARALEFWNEWSDAMIKLESDDPETQAWARQKRKMLLQLSARVPGFQPRESKEYGMELKRLSEETGIPLPR